MTFEKQVFVASGASDATPATGETVLTTTAPFPAKIVKVVTSTAANNTTNPTTFDVAVNGVVVMNEVAGIAVGAKKGVAKLAVSDVSSVTFKNAQGRNDDATPPAGGNTTAPNPGTNFILPSFPESTGLADVAEGDIVTVLVGASVGAAAISNVTVVFEKK